MPAYAERRNFSRPRERASALAAVIFVQVAVGWALLSGLHVDVSHPGDVVQRLINVTLPKPPPPVKPVHRPAPQSAPKAAPDKLGGSSGPKPAHAPPSVAPVIAVRPNAAPSGGGTGSGPALGSGAGGGTGGQGYGSGGGGGDLEKIAGDIYPSDYPRRLAKAGIGGTVKMRCTVITTEGCRTASSRARAASRSSTRSLRAWSSSASSIARRPIATGGRCPTISKLNGPGTDGR